MILVNVLLGKCAIVAGKSRLRYKGIVMIYDIIGDIHGHANKLAGLLDKLGYIHDGISHIAPHGHQAIFIGDFIDRAISS